MSRAENLPSIIESLEFRREQYGLNQAQWASILGIGAPKYSEFVHGKRTLPKVAMGRAFQFGVPAECLFQCKPNKHIEHINAHLKRRKD